jgi:hypothetical protein
MDDTTRYLNFVKKYNKTLKKKGTNWLGPEDMGKVLVDTALENNSKSTTEVSRIKSRRDEDSGAAKPPSEEEEES